MKTVFAIVAAVGVLALSACDTQPKKVLSPDFGNSVRHNMAVQIINPDAGDEQPEATDLSGPRAKGAMDRYEKGQIIEPKAESTRD
jgi:hypothetical protein